MNKIFTKEEMTVWYEEFKKTDIKHFERAIEKTIQEVKTEKKEVKQTNKNTGISFMNFFIRLNLLSSVSYFR